MQRNVTSILFYGCQRMLEAILTDVSPYKQYLLLGNAKYFFHVDLRNSILALIMSLNVFRLQ